MYGSTRPRCDEIVPLDPTDVLTAEQAGKLLEPFIKPLPANNPFTASAVF
jgi:hypothetical protein